MNKYRNYIFCCNTDEENKIIYKKLKDWGYRTFNLDDNDYINYSFYILVDVEDKRVIPGTNLSEEKLIEVIKIHHPNTDLNIYDFSTIIQFERLVNPNFKSPSYKPKKFNKTFESVNDNILPYNIWCDNREKLLSCEELFHKFGYSWGDNNTKWIMKNGYYNSQLFTFIDFKNKTFDGYITNKETHKITLNYPEDMIKITSLLKYGILRPNYSPKKFNKTFESVNEKIISIVIEIPNEIESKKYQELLFQNNIYWCDGQKTYHNILSFPVWFYVKLDKKFFSLILTEVELEEEENIMSYSDYLKIVSILNYGNVIPNYKPKKFNKTFESIDINKSRYFNKYNTIIFIVMKDDDYNKIKDFLIKINQLININLMRAIDILDFIKNSENESSYYRITLNSNDIFECSYGRLTSLQEQTRERNLKYNKLYTLDEIIKEIRNLLIDKPNYKPKKFNKSYESINNKVLWAFDMDDTLVYSKRFEEHIKPLLTEFLNPEIILKSKINDIGINISDLKYENGRIYFDDPEQLAYIPNNSGWVRKKERVYITQPDAYFMTEESMPIGTYSEIVKLYENAEYKVIITARNERLREQTELALNNLGIEKPNCGLFMYPENNFSLKVRWKIDKLMELINNENFIVVYYFDDNIKILKKMKEYFDKQEINITLYKVTENNYRKI
jgi:hypothetical protein